MYLFNRAGTEENAFNIDRLSPSGYMSYVNCPLSFYYSYIAKIKLPQPVIHLVFGSAVHKAIEEMYEGNTAYEEVFTANFTPEMLDPESREQYSKYYVMGLEMLKNYMQNHTVLDQMYGLNDGKSEFKFRKHVVSPLTGEVSSIPLSGVVDRLTNGGKVIEYKTAAKKWDAKDPKVRVQSLLYNLWYYTEYGTIPDETLYLILLKKFKKSSKDETLQILRFRATPEDLAIMFEEFQTVIDKINAGIFPRGNCSKWMCDCHKFEKHLQLTKAPEYEDVEDLPF